MIGVRRLYINYLGKGFKVHGVASFQHKSKYSGIYLIKEISEESKAVKTEREILEGEKEKGKEKQE